MNKGDALLSIATLEELQSVLFREKFDKYLSLDTRRQLISDFVSNAELVEITEEIIACRNPKDDKFFEFGGKWRGECDCFGRQGFVGTSSV